MLQPLQGWWRLWRICPGVARSSQPQAVCFASFQDATRPPFVNRFSPERVIAARRRLKRSNGNRTSSRMNGNTLNPPRPVQADVRRLYQRCVFPSLVFRSLRRQVRKTNPSQLASPSAIPAPTTPRNPQNESARQEKPTATGTTITRTMKPSSGGLYGSLLIAGETPNVQLTDGGSSPTSGLPSGMAGPPFGAAQGSAWDEHYFLPMLACTTGTKIFWAVEPEKP